MNSLQVYIDYLVAYYEFYDGRISYQAFEDKINNINLNDILPLIKDKFLAYRSSLLQEAKHIGKGGSAKDSILWSAKNMAKILTGDLNPLVDVPSVFMNRDNLKKQRQEFIRAYSESNLSIPLYEALLKDIQQNFSNKN